MTSPHPHPSQPADELDSHLVVYKDGKEVVNKTTCGLCGLIHVPTLTHELHQIIVEGQAATLKCNDCVYGLPSPHKQFVADLFAWHAHSLEIARLEARQTALQDVQVYTDPSHQKMSPFTRLKTADDFINKELATLQAALDKKKEGHENP
jgi:hypothetical protein